MRERIVWSHVIPELIRAVANGGVKDLIGSEPVGFGKIGNGISFAGLKSQDGIDRPAFEHLSG